MSDNRKKNKALGRGLSSLMSDVVGAAPAGGPEDNTQGRSPDRLVPIERIHPNPDQPRRTFDENALEDLTRSIRSKGIIQPLIVRTSPQDAEQFEIVAGERRWRAAQRAGLHDLPVLVREMSDTEVLEVAIIENIQRDDLNAIDEAAGYNQLMKRFDHTQENIATALGKSRSHIANLLRLLTLPEGVQKFVTSGDLSAGHARTLVGRDNAEALALEIIRRKLSVREAEKLAKSDRKITKKRVSSNAASKDADTKQIENDLAAQLKMGVVIDHKPGSESGKLTIKYKDLSQLDDLLRLLAGA